MISGVAKKDRMPGVLEIEHSTANRLAKNPEKDRNWGW